MVIRGKRCVHITCTKRPSFNVENNVESSRTAAYCKQHAQDGMVDAINIRCSHRFCTTMASFNIDGFKRPAYCKRHAEEGMVNVVSRRCSHNSGTRAPSWGVPTDFRASLRVRHKGDLQGGQLIHFEAVCQEAFCGKRSRWGIRGKKPTHCQRHGPAKDGLVFSTGTPVIKRVRRSPSHCGLTPPQSELKTECMF